MTYIPRSSLAKGGVSSPIPKVVKKKHTFRVFGFLGTTLLILSLLGTGGVFFYKGYLEDTKEAAKQDLYLAEQKKGDSDTKIQEIKTYHAQLGFAERLLREHMAPSKLLDILEMQTKKTVQFKQFSYEYDPGFEAFLTLGGATQAFTSVVSQKMQLNPISLNSPYDVALVEDVTRNNSTETEKDKNALYSSDEVQFSVTGILRTEQFEYTGVSSAPFVEQNLENPENEVILDETFEGDNNTDL